MNKNIKIFALLICMLMTTSAIWADDNASDFYFPEGMTWTISILSDYGCDNKSVFVLQGDTLINGKTYHNVRLYNAKEQQVLSIPITAEGKKIYAHIYDRDILLYDFGLEVGDSIMHYRSINLEDGIPEDLRFDPDSSYIHVTMIDSITLLDGRRAKCLHYKDRRYQEEYYIRADIEYVGCSYGGLFSIIDVPLLTTCGSNACCCTLNGELIYEDYVGVCALMDIHGTSPNAYLPSLCDEWHMETYTVVDPGNPNYREYTQRLTTDTIIDGKRYRQLRGTANWPSTYLYDNNYLGALREGNNADIYYVPAGGTHEFLLYAFNVQIGDTLTNLWIGNHFSEPYGYKAKVTGIGTGKFRRIDLLVFGTDDNKDIECGEETYWLDSIGRNTGPVWANPVCYAIDPTPEVICACKEGRKVFARDAKCACDPLRLKSLCDTWNIHGVAFPDGHDHHLMFTQQLTTDTLIAGQRYVRLKQGSAYLGALRETDNARIYFIPAGSTHEYLLYAFHANQGDTFDNVWFGGRPSDFPNGSHVTIREITEQNGRKVFELDASYTTPYEEIVEWPYSIWIEGVGLQDGPAGSDCPLDCLGDYGQSVLCAYKDGVHVYASAFAEEHGCWYTTDDQIDTIPLYVNDGPGSTTVTPVDPNQVVATLNDNLLTIREQSGEEVTYSLAVTPISHAPARHELPEAQKEVAAGNFRNSVAVQLSEDGSYTLTLSKAGWENDIYGTFDYTASGLQPVAATDAPARKLLRNGQLLIQQGDKIFTLTGVQTK